jgi:hypothetical protein
VIWTAAIHEVERTPKSEASVISLVSLALGFPALSRDRGTSSFEAVLLQTERAGGAASKIAAIPSVTVIVWSWNRASI